MKKIGGFSLTNIYYIFSRYKFNYYVKCYSMINIMYFTFFKIYLFLHKRNAVRRYDYQDKYFYILSMY